jgi:hypothetical protein
MGEIESGGCGALSVSNPQFVVRWEKDGRYGIYPVSEMVERVAAAIIAGFDEITEPEEREDALKLARAAIAAMREPTEAMLIAGQNRNARLDAYRDMIDEALK